MTTEEISNKLEFRVFKKLLKKTFPFIIDIGLSQGWEEYDTVLFLEAVIDPFKYQEYTGEPLDSPLIDIYLRQGTDPHGTSTGLGMSKEIGKKIIDESNRKLKMTHQDNNVIPTEDKVPHWSVKLSTFIIPKDIATEYLSTRKKNKYT